MSYYDDEFQAVGMYKPHKELFALYGRYVRQEDDSVDRIIDGLSDVEYLILCEDASIYPVEMINGSFKRCDLSDNFIGVYTRQELLYMNDATLDEWLNEGLPEW